MIFALSDNRLRTEATAERDAIAGVINSIRFKHSNIVKSDFGHRYEIVVVEKFGLHHEVAAREREKAFHSLLMAA